MINPIIGGRLAHAECWRVLARPRTQVRAERGRWIDMACADVTNLMTVDVEDWAQSVLDPSHEVSARVVDNVRRVLDLLDRFQIRATFFALGKVCERFPTILPTIASAGHEIASHGYGHKLVYHLTPGAFAADLTQSIRVILEQTGQRPLGYRAPAFSITAKTRWAGPILAKYGFRYSSSIFPITGKRYGIASEPRFAHPWNNCDLLEVPPSTIQLAGRNWPVLGGGYTRLLPAPLRKHAIAHLNRQVQPAVIYMHPYELAAGEVRSFIRAGTSVTFQRRFMQELWRSRVPRRLEALFREFAFGPMDRIAPPIHSHPRCFFAENELPQAVF